MDFDFRDREDVLRLAGWIAVGVFIATGIFMVSGADTGSHKIMAGVKAITYGVAAGLIVVAAIAVFRLIVFLVSTLLQVVQNTITAIIEGLLNLFVWLISAALRLPIIVFRPLIMAVARLVNSAPSDSTGDSRFHHDKTTDDKHQQRSKTNTSDANPSEKHALDLFEMSKPYTLEQLKKRRMELLKKVHPDQGGSNMMARMVNEAYELLKSKI